MKRDGNLIQNFQMMLLRKKFELDNVDILHFQHTYFYEIWDEIIFTTLTHTQRNPWYYVKFWQLFRVLLQLHSTNNQWRLFRWDLKDVNCVKLSLFCPGFCFCSWDYTIHCQIQLEHFKQLRSDHFVPIMMRFQYGLLLHSNLSLKAV